MDEWTPLLICTMARARSGDAPIVVFLCETAIYFNQNIDAHPHCYPVIFVGPVHPHLSPSHPPVEPPPLPRKEMTPPTLRKHSRLAPTSLYGTSLTLGTIFTTSRH